MSMYEALVNNTQMLCEVYMKSAVCGRLHMPIMGT